MLFVWLPVVLRVEMRGRVRSPARALKRRKAGLAAANERRHLFCHQKKLFMRLRDAPRRERADGAAFFLTH